MNRIALAAALVAGLLAGCNRDPQPAPSADAAADAGTLPRPEAGPGSVTGFDGDAPPPRAAGTSAGAASDGEDTPVADAAPETGGFDLGSPPQDPVAGTTATPAAPAPTPVPAAPAPEPGAAEAAAVVRSYYGAINAGQYPRAYALWSDGGRASGQTAGQFAGGFDDTAQVTVSTGTPGRVEGAAGSRYVTIPVAVEAVQDDGTIRHYDGTYTLRRAVVDGATAEQRQWRISNADLRQVE
jgi:hypothetical protein